MKRILSVLLALVMIVGMIPMSILSASAATATATITFDDTAKRTTFNASQAIWEEDGVTVTNNKASGNDIADYSNPARFYKGSELIIAYPQMTKIEVTCGSSSYATALANSTFDSNSKATANGSVVTITLTATADTVTVTMGAQARVKSMTVTYSSVDSGECAHTNTETIAAVAATCTTAGNTAGVKCTDCGATLEGNETIEALGHSNDAGVVTAPTCTEDGYTLYTCTVCGSTKKDDYVDATGHNYVDGVCTGCGLTLPTDLAGKYYIAAIRKEGNYMYMSNDLGSGSTSRYQQVDSGLTTLPTSIETVVDAQVFELVASGDGYKIKTGDQYLGYTSGNSGTLVVEADARVVTIENGAEGAYVIHFTVAADDERYLALNSNSTSPYFAWYKGAGNQIQDLYLIPVSESAEVCTHTNTTVEGKVDATCTTAGSTGTEVCSDCGATITEATEIEALGHNYVEGTCSVCGATKPTTSDSTYVLTSSLAVGDQIVIVTEQAKMELSSFSTSSTVYGIGTAYTDIPAGTMAWIVEEGTVAGSYAFKNSDGNYLYWSSGNSLKASATKDAQSSWKVSFDGNDVTLVTAGNSDAARRVAWNSSSPRFANYKDSTVVGNASYYAIQFYKYTIVDGCVHEVAEDAWTIVTAATCETAGFKTGTCSKCGETVEKEIPALGHAYSYNAETGMMVCANCGDSFMNTIAEAKAYTDGNQIYYIKGIVTYVSGQTVYMQDATGGICVYFTDAESAANIAVGDELLVMDTMTTYKGLIETTYTKSTEIQVLSNGNQLPVQTVTVADLNADTANEYLGERVTITGLTIGMINSASTTTLTDADGNTINLYKASGLASNVTENDIVTVTAIVSAYNSYQLIVNPGTAATDVVVTTEGIPSDLPLSDISAAKAGTEGTFFKVKGVVTFVDGASVYMQDATGGIVARLASGVTAPAVGTEIEAIGAYTTYNGLIQLEGATFTEVSTGNTVAAKEITLADLLADTTNTYLSEKVSLEKLEITKVGTYNSTYQNIDYTVSDGTNTIKLYRAPLADEANKLAVGDVIDVIAVVGTFNGYQLRVVKENDITKAQSVASIGETQYYSFEEAYAAAAENDVIVLLADCEVNDELTYNKNVIIDLNGNDLLDMKNTGAIIAMDSATAGYTDVECGILNVVTEVTAADDYLASYDDEEEIFTFHAYAVEITHVSLNPGADALGFKAELKGDSVVQAAVTAYGFNMGVVHQKTYTCEGKIDDGVFTLRLSGVMACNGGEMNITASAFVMFGSETASSDEKTTTMKETIEYINNNWTSFDADKQAVVVTYVSDNYEAMKSWNVANIYVPETEEVPAA